MFLIVVKRNKKKKTQKLNRILEKLNQELRSLDT